MIEREHSPPQRRLGPPVGVDDPGGAGQGVCAGVAVATRCGEGCGVAPVGQDKDVTAAFAEWKNPVP
jgi:hypothetical protein